MPNYIRYCSTEKPTLKSFRLSNIHCLSLDKPKEPNALDSSPDNCRPAEVLSFGSSWPMIQVAKTWTTRAHAGSMATAATYLGCRKTQQTELSATRKTLFDKHWHVRDNREALYVTATSLNLTKGRQPASFFHDVR